MNTSPKRLQTVAQENLENTSNQHTEGRTAVDFETPEALIAWDRSQTPVPEELRARVMASLAHPAGAASSTGDDAKPWWRRLF
jgi:hypothetical protein